MSYGLEKAARGQKLLLQSADLVEHEKNCSIGHKVCEKEWKDLPESLERTILMVKKSEWEFMD